MKFFIFFFQAEDGIRDWSVTGVQTCALPILRLIERGFERFGTALDESQRTLCRETDAAPVPLHPLHPALRHVVRVEVEIGRASCRERVLITVVAVSDKEYSCRNKMFCH